MRDCIYWTRKGGERRKLYYGGILWVFVFVLKLPNEPAECTHKRRISINVRLMRASRKGLNTREEKKLTPPHSFLLKTFNPSPWCHRFESCYQSKPKAFRSRWYTDTHSLRVPWNERVLRFHPTPPLVSWRFFLAFPALQVDCFNRGINLL